MQGSNQERVLYLGMANDIMSPLLLAPNLLKLYVISKFDNAFCSGGTWESQMQDIRNYLTNGNDKGSYSYDLFIKAYVVLFPKKKLCKDYHYLEGPSTIISEEYDDTVWRLKFLYNDQERELIYYHHRDFLTTWPEDITNISHIMGQGSVDTDVINKKEGLTFRKMFEERTTEVFYYYALYFSHKHFDKLIIKGGQQRDGTEIGKCKVDKKIGIELRGCFAYPYEIVNYDT